MGTDVVSAITKTTVIGDVRLVTGTYTNASGSTGGTIATGLDQIFFFGTNAMTTAGTTVSLIAISGGTVTITTIDNEDGQWIAIGV